MTWVWSIPIDAPPGNGLNVPQVSVERLRVVVPTFRDWEDARLSIEAVLACRPRPAEIVLVNDNAEPGVPAWAHLLGVLVVNYPGNRGPAFARNAGACLRTGRRIDWIYFTDTACVRRADFFASLVDASASMPAAALAIAAPVGGVDGPRSLFPINTYMTEEAILCPPRDRFGPQAIVTANAAVALGAFRAVGGFDTSFPFAAGEDLDLGLRLRRLGNIGWASECDVVHRFEESIADFDRRFVRYGAGNAHLEVVHRLPSMRVAELQPRDPALGYLARLQVAAMRSGYDGHLQRLARRASKLDLRRRAAAPLKAA